MCNAKKIEQHSEVSIDSGINKDGIYQSMRAVHCDDLMDEVFRARKLIDKRLVEHAPTASLSGLGS